MTRTLYLHAGHNKTGSSFLQQAFLLNRELLLERHGICYPTTSVMEDYNQQFLVTSGNGFLLQQKPSSWTREDAHSYLFSREQMFVDFLAAENRKVIDTCRKELGIEQVKILFFIRNPVEYAMSSYQQAIKGHGFSAEIEKYFRRYKMQKIHDFIKIFHDDPSVELCVYNYSKVKNDLVGCADAWMGLDGATMDWRIPDEHVNRGLTHGEFYLQMALNQALPKQVTHQFYRKVVEGYPQAKPARMIPPVEVQEALLENNRGLIDAINAMIPENQRYDASTLPFQPEPEEVVFTREQLQVICAAIGDIVADACKQQTQLQQQVRQHMPRLLRAAKRVKQLVKGTA